MEKCKHIKVYENQLIATFTPKRRWICRSCLEEGTDVIGDYKPNEYKQLKNKKETVNKK